MTLRVRAFIQLAVIFCIAANGLGWAAHVDAPPPAEARQVSEHAHLDAGELVDACDHCCHAGAHLVALPPAVAGYTVDTDPRYVPATARRYTEAAAEPPFIPPIA